MPIMPFVHRSAAWLLLGCLFLACAPREQDHRYALRGGHAVGTRDLIIRDGDRASPLPLTLWYPAVNPTGAKEEIIYQGATEGIGASGQSAPIQGRALADAAPDASGGIFPLVVFASCRDRGRMLYASLLEHLASHGFVVIAVGPVAGSANPVVRVRTVTRTLDFAESLTRTGGPFAGLIDGSRTAVAGHCDGAFAALLAGGARMNLTAASALCASSGLHTIECDRWLTPRGRADFARAAGLPKEPSEGLYPGYGDPRVKALIAMGIGGEVEASSELAALTLPVLVISGSRDRERPSWGADRVYQNLPAPRKSKLVFVGGGHDLYCVARSDIVVAADTAGLDPGLWDTRRAHHLINHVATAFLLAVLKRDPEAHRALLTGAMAGEQVEYATTWKP